ncbi:MAG TPA: alkaline phosphatase D family protein [Hyphomonadaceae bacterium]|jgi:alkaline phosphatase D|nr:alkaline phosphatase D family protein [Hyphomonadaceae bacterium]
MTKLTRRRALSLGVMGAGAAGLAAGCETMGMSSGPPSSAGKAQFLHGVASGDPTQDKIIIWTRVTPEAPGPVAVTWKLSKDPAFKSNVKRGVFNTGPERDYTVKVDVANLEPGQTYHYYFSVGGVASVAGNTKTLPAAGLADYRMAVVSCSNWPFGFFNAYKEIGKRTDLDAVIHLGDYIYEYGQNGYGGEIGKQLGRNHEPAHECIALADYRLRYAQYRSDRDLQSAHAIVPWFCTWDDHETANNSYRTGAENHQPETEGEWSKRKAEAVQAYLEWMPVRDPEAGKAREAIWHKVDIGDLATLFLLESRLVGRGEDITIGEVGLAPPDKKQAVADAIMARVNDPQRTMLGAEQEAWLAAELKASVDSGRKWQVLGNQVTMAKVKMPDLAQGLPSEKYVSMPETSKRAWDSAKWGLPWNLDSWSGFPAARERLYAASRAAKAKLVVLAGDTHTSWANELFDEKRFRIGVEFGCTSITSQGAGDTLPFQELNWLMAEANDDVIYYNAFNKGFTVLILKADQVEAEFVKVSTIRSPVYLSSVDAHFVAHPDETGALGGLQRLMG